MGAARESALVLRHLAALRRGGTPAGEAVALVAAALPDGARKEELARVAEALARGETAEGHDPLVKLASRGEAAGPSALEEAARASELTREAEAAVGGAGTLLVALGVIALGFMVVMPFIVAGFGSMYDGFGGSLPAPTALFARPGVAVFLFGLVAVAAFGLRFATPKLLAGWSGGRALGGASQLRVVAAGLEAGLSEADAVGLVEPGASTIGASRALAFDVFEKQALEQALASGAAAEAVRRIAVERERAGAAMSRRFRTFAPVVFFGAAAALAGLFIVALYLPIFAIAGAIK